MRTPTSTGRQVLLRGEPSRAALGVSTEQWFTAPSPHATCALEIPHWKRTWSTSQGRTWGDSRFPLGGTSRLLYLLGSFGVVGEKKGLGGKLAWPGT